MLDQTDPKSSRLNSPLWLWARIRALRNFREEITNLETCLITLKNQVEIEKKKQSVSK